MSVHLRQFFFELAALSVPVVLGTSQLELHISLVLLLRALGYLIVQHLLQVGYLTL